MAAHFPQLSKTVVQHNYRPGRHNRGQGVPIFSNDHFMASLEHAIEHNLKNVPNLVCIFVPTLRKTQMTSLRAFFIPRKVDPVVSWVKMCIDLIDSRLKKRLLKSQNVRSLGIDCLFLF